MSGSRRALLLAGLLVTALASGGCSALADEDDGLDVAAAFYPLEYVAERVAGEHASVETLSAPGQDSHAAEPSVRETALVAAAELVLVLHDFQPAIDDAVEQNAEGAVLDAADVVTLEPFADHDHDEEHDGELAHDEGHAHEDGEAHAHEHEGDLDPHFWLDPLLMADLGDAVAAELSVLDPDHAADFEDAAAGLRVDLERLDEQYVAGLARCARDTVVVSHDAFGYLARYGLHLEPVAGLSPDAEPTPAVLGRLQRLIEEEGITTVFSERLASPRLTEALATDAGIGTAVLDPLEGLSDETSDEDYLSLMRDNLAALRKANGCQ